MAAKDADHGGDKAKLVGEVADLWFHCMIALAHYGLSPADVLAELQRREGTSGIEEKALRKVLAREGHRFDSNQLIRRRTAMSDVIDVITIGRRSAQVPQDGRLGQLHPAPDRGGGALVFPAGRLAPCC
jgi:hypothetical protein